MQKTWLALHCQFPQTLVYLNNVKLLECVRNLNIYKLIFSWFTFFCHIGANIPKEEK